MRDRRDLLFNSRAAFLAYASRAMRPLLVDLARERLAQTHSAELLPLTLAIEVADQAAGTPEQWLPLNRAMERLGQVEPRLLQVCEMRAALGLGLGLDMAEMAAALGLSEPTIKRDWKQAKAVQRFADDLQRHVARLPISARPADFG